MTAASRGARACSRLLVLVSWLAVGGACEQRPASRAAAEPTVERPPERMPAAPSANQSTSAHSGAPAGAVVPAAIAVPDDAAVSASGADAGEETLVGEERERDPRSGTVEIKVIVDQRRQAHVIWGRKDFGIAPLEIERPRDSGPLDLVVIAPGYLPYHARAFTDRDDTIMVHLYSATEAPQLLGYRASEVPAASIAAPGSTPTSNQNRQKTR